jgi:predicted esterase
MEETKRLACKTFLTGNTNPAAGLPLIVPLHFMGSDPEQIFEVLLGSFDLPARVIAPCGQYEYEGRHSWFPDDLYNQSGKDQGRFVDEVVGILLENVESWKQEFPLRGRPIYLGVSQGGDMCFTLAARHADHFGLCLPIAGRLLAEEITRKNEAGLVRIHHGDKDPIVPVATAREAKTHLSTAGFNVELREYEGVGHAVPPEMRKAIHDDIRAAIQGQAGDAAFQK